MSSAFAKTRGIYLELGQGQAKVASKGSYENADELVEWINTQLAENRLNRTDA